MYATKIEVQNQKGKIVDIPDSFQPQDETWTDFDGPSWIQYDLFRKYKNRGPKT